ncbi:M42 family metallopeptidase [Rubritalea profundi]|uniref:M42 family metallopeptidase n=1 Tax=Rubritalea profundi TaxID=1658618 RepID=UPI001F0B9553|nr:M42 family metallopeptidase [Rubritalea profundi]
MPGYEDEVRDIFIEELVSVGDLSSDRMGGVYCERGQGPKILLAGHMDEIGFRVQNITPDGFIKFLPVGGWWAHTLLSQRVEVKTRSGAKVLGVIASKPPHFLPESERSKVMALGALFIDVGAASREEVERDFGIQLGDPIAPETEFTAMQKRDYYMAKAFDNRVGMACAIQTVQELSDEELPNTLIACGTVQEEVGLRGAKVAAVKVQPDVAIVLEGPPADDAPGFPKSEAQGRLGGGVQIRMQDPTAIMNPRLVELVVETAEREGIRYQLTMRTSGGTDAGSFHQSNEGVPSIVLGTPARYIHSHNGIIDINDYLEMVKLSLALVRRLDAETVAGLTQYL